jgi:hypothetical protein
VGCLENPGTPRQCICCTGQWSSACPRLASWSGYKESIFFNYIF